MITSYKTLPKILTGLPVLTPTVPVHTLPALFISHGTPQLAFERSATTNALAKLGQNLPKPNAIIIMSAHWQSFKLEINSHPCPPTWHDFSGVDKRLYEIDYPAKGLPKLAQWLAMQLQEHDIAVSLNPLRAFDHGVWVPLRHLYPNADVPILQLSLPYHFDALACYQLGSLFASLRDEQILLVGSGGITHNVPAMRWHELGEDDTVKAFRQWLLNRLKTDIPSALDWKAFLDYRQVHPSDEHLLPLFFALGAGQRVSVVHESTHHHSLGMDIYRFD